MGAAEDIRFIQVLIMRRQLNENKEAKETQTNSRGRENMLSKTLWIHLDAFKLEVFTNKAGKHPRLEQICL